MPYTPLKSVTLTSVNAALKELWDFLALPINADKLVNGEKNKVFTKTNYNKLAGIKSGATKNDTDIELRTRESHIGQMSAEFVDSDTDKRFVTDVMLKFLQDSMPPPPDPENPDEEAARGVFVTWKDFINVQNSMATFEKIARHLEQKFANVPEGIEFDRYAIIFGSGSPEGVQVAKPGRLYVNELGGAGQTLWIKEIGTEATGWKPK